MRRELEQIARESDLRREYFYDSLSRAFTPFDLLLRSVGVQVRPTLRGTMTSHVDWLLASSEKASGLEVRLRMMTGDHLLDIGATSACLAIACVHEHLLDTNLIPAISEGFIDATKTTEELHELANSYMPTIHSLLSFV